MTLIAAHTFNHETAQAGREHAAFLVLQAVRAVIEEHLASHELSQAFVAARLGFAPRTLARRLTDIDTNYQAVLDSVRVNQAQAMLVRGDELPDIWPRLGLTTGPAFHRAFKRCTGTTPKNWLRAWHALGDQT